MVMSPPTLIVALDVAEARSALELREKLAGVVDFFKVGSELYTAAGPHVVKELCRSEARVFLDLKFHDIPNTVSGAVAAACRLGVSLVDVHASGGKAMMSAAAESVRTSASDAPRPLLFAVTVLTHLGDDDLASLGLRNESRSQVVRLAELALECGVDGVVASAAEVTAIRDATGDRLAVLVPAVRPAWANQAHDQKRVATPAEAARAGAGYVVVGRAITKQPDPRAAASRILEELASA
jgi:orotidine-5'-phosphate decarboxylase